ncbi:polyprenyl synthetase family protein [Virgibacillus sp. NKC19-16]|uniref:polyprenyl synthetase family protein n=1 Tax=Virgibacillus salidurans TaxID=2831673 RepID=UPI001F3CB554|nr:polyprenyl synthetase family protein [Virgibacillus sp. NKC19-16]UJL47742.1 polyprenyl synthetase family protein [Virgibacillus sp. NKC19-16]
MNKQLNADAGYQLAEKKAVDYFDSLSVQLAKKTYAATLTKDIHAWKKNHIHHHSLLYLFKGKKDFGDYHNYISWLDYTGKLDNYLERSISYIFMRDLGKDLNSSDTEDRIQHVVNDLKQHLMHSATATEHGKTELFSMTWLYRFAQKEGIEPAMIWVLNKIKKVSSYIPKEMNAEEAKRKLIKIIAGVIIHQIEENHDEISPEERARKLDRAIKLGYSYGLTYPFIDDLLDSEVLSDHEKIEYSSLIRQSIVTQSVPELFWTGNNKELIQYIHSELCEAFEYIKTHLRPETREKFFDQSYIFFHSQEVDRLKDLSNANYTNEELYIPVILKSASSRLMVRSVISAQEDKGVDNRTFFYGIYNQLSDDFTDMFDDLEAGSVTPYTYYIKYHDKRPDLINPFELYWTVISNLIHNVYHSDPKSCEVILDRAINGQKRFKERIGKEKYNEVMELFASGNRKFHKLIQKMVRKADDVDFFDKLLRDHISTNFKKEQKEREDFLDTIKIVHKQINNLLYIPKADDLSSMKEPITDAANYSLEGNGKRLRPIITWVMGVNEYGLDSLAIVPLLKSLEYMHTASLIYDDLPSQDNASIRRGLPTLHRVYNTAMAELTGLYLTQKAVEEQASLERFDSKAVIHLIHYAAGKIADMCKGQALDLDSKGKQLTLEQLNTICFYKTGIGFEASLVMPAILAGKQESELKVLKKFAYHAGIAFQIKDDLLDVEGDQAALGKEAGKDAENDSSTFVSILGADGARMEMWEHYCLAMEVLPGLKYHTAYLRHLLNYIVNRDY